MPRKNKQTASMGGIIDEMRKELGDLISGLAPTIEDGVKQTVKEAVAEGAEEGFEDGLQKGIKNTDKIDLQLENLINVKKTKKNFSKTIESLLSKRERKSKQKIESDAYIDAQIEKSNVALEKSLKDVEKYATKNLKTLNPQNRKRMDPDYYLGKANEIEDYLDLVIEKKLNISDETIKKLRKKAAQYKKISTDKSIQYYDDLKALPMSQQEQDAVKKSLELIGKQRALYKKKGLKTPEKINEYATDLIEAYGFGDEIKASKKRQTETYNNRFGNKIISQELSEIDKEIENVVKQRFEEIKSSIKPKMTKSDKAKIQSEIEEFRNIVSPLNNQSANGYLQDLDTAYGSIKIGRSSKKKNIPTEATAKAVQNEAKTHVEAAKEVKKHTEAQKELNRELEKQEEVVETTTMATTAPAHNSFDEIVNVSDIKHGSDELNAALRESMEHLKAMYDAGDTESEEYIGTLYRIINLQKEMWRFNGGKGFGFDSLKNKTGKNANSKMNLQDSIFNDFMEFSGIDKNIVDFVSQQFADLKQKQEKIFDDKGLIPVSSYKSVQKVVDNIGREFQESGQQATSATDQARQGLTEMREEAEKTNEVLERVAYHYGALDGAKKGSKSHKFGDEIHAYYSGKRNGGRGWADGTGTYVTSDPNQLKKAPENDPFKKFYAIDTSKLKLYEAHVEKDAQAYYEFAHKLEQYCIKMGSGFQGFNKNLKGIDPHVLYESVQKLFKDSTLTFDEFNEFLNSMSALVKESGMAADGSVNASKMYQFRKKNGSDDIKTRFLKLLGFQGTNFSGTSYDTVQSGSVIFDIDEASIIKSGKTINDVTDNIKDNTEQAKQGLSEVRSEAEKTENAIVSDINEVTDKLKEAEEKRKTLDTTTPEQAITDKNINTIKHETEETNKLEQSVNNVNNAKKDNTAIQATEASVKVTSEEAKAMSDLFDKAMKAAEAKKVFTEENKALLVSVVDSLKGLNSEGKGFENLNKLINNLANNKSNRIDTLLENIKKLRDLLSKKIDQNSFLTTLRDLSKEGNNLKDLAEVLKASKKQLEDAKSVVGQPNKPVIVKMPDHVYRSQRRDANSGNFSYTRYGDTPNAAEYFSGNVRTTLGQTVIDENRMVNYERLLKELIKGDTEILRLEHEINNATGNAKVGLEIQRDLVKDRLLLYEDMISLIQSNPEYVTNGSVEQVNYIQGQRDDNELKVRAQLLQNDAEAVDKFNTAYINASNSIQKLFDETSRLGIIKFNKELVDLSDELLNVGNNSGALNTVEEHIKSLSGLIQPLIDQMKQGVKDTSFDKSVARITASIEKMKATASELGINQFNKRISGIENALNNVGTNEYALNALSNQLQQLQIEFNKVADAERNARKQTEQNVNDYIQLTNHIGTLNAALRALQDNPYIDNNDPAIIQTQALLNSYETLRNSISLTGITTEQQTRINNANAEANLRLANAIKNKTVADAKASAAGLKEEEVLNNTRSTLLKTASAYLLNGKLMRQYGEQIHGYLSEIQNPNTTIDRLQEIKLDLREIDSQARITGNTGKTITQMIGGRLKSLLAYLSSFTSFYRVIGAFRQAITTIQDLDTALVDLRKTTTMSNAELNQFYLQSNKIGKQLGVTTKEIISQAAAWSRLGYSTKEQATTMAQLSSKFASISPGMTTENSTDYLVSTMQAFGIATDEVERKILDNVNRIGNTFATTNAEIGEMLTRSSAAMKAANNTLEETIALESAAVQITRNAETTGTAFRTISMRIRGFDEETEELSEDLENISGDIYDLTKIGENGEGIHIFTDSSRTEYKSTYQILKEIAGIWKDLTDKQQANLLEKLAGKRGGQVLAGILNDFSEVDRAMKEMGDSAGAADAEMSIIETSLEYKLNRLHETWTGFLQSNVSRDALGNLIDGLTRLSEVLTTIFDKVGILQTAFVGLTTILGSSKLGLFDTKNQKTIIGGIVASRNAKQDALSYQDVLNSYNNNQINILTEDFTKWTNLTENARSNIIKIQGEVNKAGLSGQDAINRINTQLDNSLTKFGKLKSIGKSLINGFVSFAASSVISGVITWISNALDKAIVTEEEAKKMAIDFRDAYASLHKTQSNVLSTLSSLEDEFNVLSNGVDETGNNIGLTTEEFNRYHEITKTIEEYTPSLIAGYDETGNAIVRLTNNVNSLTDAYKQAQQAAAYEAYNKTTDDGDVTKGVYKNAQNVISGYSFTGLYGDTKYDISNIGYNPTSLTTDWDETITTFSAETIRKAYQDLAAMSYKEALDAYDSDALLHELLKKSGFDNGETNENSYQIIHNDIQTQSNEYLRSLEQAANDIKNKGHEYAEAYSGYWTELSDSQRKYFDLTLNNLDYKQMLEKDLFNEDEMKRYVNNMAQFFGRLNPKALEQLEIRSNLITEVNNDKVSIDDYLEKLSELNDWINTFSDDNERQMIELFFGVNSESELKLMSQIQHLKDLMGENFTDEFLSKLSTKDLEKLSGDIAVPIYEKVIAELKSLGAKENLTDEEKAEVKERADYLTKLIQNIVAGNFTGFTEQEILDFLAVPEVIDISPRIRADKTVKSVESLRSAMGGITTIIETLNNKDIEFKGFDSSTIQSVSSAFSDFITEQQKDGKDVTTMTSTLEAFNRTLIEQPNNINAIREATNNLMTAYIDQTDILKNLDESSREWAIQQLKDMKIKNAEEVVTNRLNTVNQTALSKTKELSSAFEKYGDDLESGNKQARHWNDGIDALSTAFAEMFKVLDENGKLVTPEIDDSFIEGNIDLIKKVADGDTDALNQLFDKYEEIYGKIANKPILIKAVIDESSFKQIEGQAYQAVDAMADVENAIGSLGDLYGQVVKKSKDYDEDTSGFTFGFANASTINSVESSFSKFIETMDEGAGKQKLSHALKEFQKTLIETPDDTKVAQEAINKLITAYIDQTDYIKNLTEENKEWTKVKLKDLGVTNAEEFVEARLNKTNRKLLDGTKKLSKVFRDNAKVLADESINTTEWYNALNGDDGLIKALQDMFTITDDSGEKLFAPEVDSTFIINNLDLIRRVAEGDSEAIQELRQAMQEDFVANIKINGSSPEEIRELQNYLERSLAKINLDDIEVGTYIDDSPVFESVNSMIAALDQWVKAGKISADQMNSILASVGVVPEIKYEDAKITISKDQQNQIANAVLANGGSTSDAIAAIKSANAAIQVPSIRYKVGTNIPNAKFTAPATKATSGGSGGSSGGGGENNLNEDTEETFDWIEVKIQRIEEEISRLDKTVNNVYDNWGNRNESLGDEIDKITERMEVHRHAAERYLQNANDVTVSNAPNKEDYGDDSKQFEYDLKQYNAAVKAWKTGEYQKKVREGLIGDGDIEKIQNKYLVEAINLYKELYQKHVDAKDAMQQDAIDIGDGYQKAFDNIKTQFDELISEFTHGFEIIDEQINRTEAHGYFVSKKYYQDQKQLVSKQLTEQKKHYNDLVNARDKAVEAGALEQYSETWYNMTNDINSVENEVNSLATQLVTLDKNIRQLSWDGFDWAIDRLGVVTDEAEFLIDLLDQHDIVTDLGRFNERGWASVGLHAIEYDTFMAKAVQYAQQIRAIEEQIAEDPYDKELIARREELLGLQQESIKAAEAEKEAVRDLVEQGILMPHYLVMSNDILFNC